MPHTLLRRAACAGLAAAALASVPASADAASFIRDTSACPSGKVALGGGAQVVGEGSQDFRTTLQESTFGTVGGGATSLWMTALRNDDGVAHKIGISAVCAPKPAGYEVARRDVAVPAYGFLRTTVACPSGKVALAGGAQVVGEGSADFRTRIQESAPGTVGYDSRSVWLTALRNHDSRSHTIGLFAACASKPAGYQVVRRDVSVPAGGFLRSTATCPSGTVVLGGGSQVVGEGTADFRTRMQESSPGTINGGAQSLHLTALRNHDSKPHTAGLFAVCASAPSGYQVVRKDVIAG